MLTPIRANAAAMANRAPACHTKQIAWQLENGCYVLARDQAVCDLGIGHAKVFGVEVKLPNVRSLKGLDEPAGLPENGVYSRLWPSCQKID